MADLTRTQTDQQTSSIQLAENARTVLVKRYLRKGPDGKPVETPEEMFRRVARAIAEPEQAHGGDVASTERRSIACSPICASSPTRPPSPARARRWASLPRVLSCPSPTTWDGAATASSRRCAMRR